MSHQLEHAAVVVAAFVVVVMVVLFGVALSTYLRDRRTFVAWIAAAFAVFALKNVALVVALTLHFRPHELVELAAALMDLAVAMLLLAPLFLPRAHD